LLAGHGVGCGMIVRHVQPRGLPCVILASLAGCKRGRGAAKNWKYACAGDVVRRGIGVPSYYLVSK
jgi:hypothetical protein